MEGTSTSSEEGSSGLTPVTLTQRASRGKNKKYFCAVPVIPGESEAYVLPAGATACPIEECPAFERLCHPHWRLNEHMKLRHGWPRKNTQPNTDRRLSGKHRSRNYQRQVVTPIENGRYKSKYQAKNQLDGAASNLTSPTTTTTTPTSPEQDERKENQPTPPPARPQRKRKRATSKDTNVSLSSNIRSLKLNMTSSAKEHNDEREGSDTTMEDSSPSPPPQKPIEMREGDPDKLMIAEINDYIQELMSKKDNASTVDEAKSAERMVNDLRAILVKNPPRINCIVPAGKLEALIPLYKALAERRNRKASIYQMPRSTIDAALGKPVPQPPYHNHQMQAQPQLAQAVHHAPTPPQPMQQVFPAKAAKANAQAKATGLKAQQPLPSFSAMQSSFTAVNKNPDTGATPKTVTFVPQSSVNNSETPSSPFSPTCHFTLEQFKFPERPRRPMFYG